MTNVAEVASIGGMVRQYQIVLDPERLRAYNLPHSKVIDALQRANQESGGSVLELGEAEYMVRVSGYLRSLEDFRKIPLLSTDAGVSVRLGDVARVQLGPEMRRGIAEPDGEGEVVGGVIVMRSGKNALETISAVKARIEALKPGLPSGVEIVPVYDRSGLIQRAIDHLRSKLLEEFVVVGLVCLAFLFHLRSALVAIVASARCTGSIADHAAAGRQRQHHVAGRHRHRDWGDGRRRGGDDRERSSTSNSGGKHTPAKRSTPVSHWRVIGDAATEVGPALFFSLLIITLSFIPIFTLEAQEGRLFAPLAFTKTYAMAAAAGLSVTLVPVLMGYLIRGRIPGRTAQSAESAADSGVSATTRRGLALPRKYPGGCASGGGPRLVASQSTGRRIHAAARRG